VVTGCGMIRVVEACTIGTGTAITGGATTGVAVAPNVSNNIRAISAKTPKGTAIPTAMATADV